MRFLEKKKKKDIMSLTPPKIYLACGKYSMDKARYIKFLIKSHMLLKKKKLHIKNKRT